MLNEVAPPGYGHTKSDKEKGVKKGGTAAAFDRARKRGDFKGSKSDMFAIMWSQKNKGDKPHYKPGTNEKKKKYQDESFEIDSKAHKKVQRQAKIRNLAKGNENPNEKSAAERKLKGPKLVGEEVSRRNKPSAIKKKKALEKLLLDREVNKIQKEGKLTHLARASVLDASDDPKDQDKAREIRTRFDYESLKKQIAKKKKPRKPAVKEEMTYQEAIDAGWEMSGEGIWMPPQTETVTEKISFPSFKKKVVERKPEKAQDAGAKARRAMKRREHAKYVSGSEDIVPDNIRD